MRDFASRDGIPGWRRAHAASERANLDFKRKYWISDPDRAVTWWTLARRWVGPKPCDPGESPVPLVSLALLDDAHTVAIDLPYALSDRNWALFQQLAEHFGDTKVAMLEVPILGGAPETFEWSDLIEIPEPATVDLFNSLQRVEFPARASLEEIARAGGPEVPVVIQLLAGPLPLDRVVVLGDSGRWLLLYDWADEDGGVLQTDDLGFAFARGAVTASGMAVTT